MGGRSHMQVVNIWNTGLDLASFSAGEKKRGFV